MASDYDSTLALIKELHALGATHVSVGDVRVRFAQTPQLPPEPEDTQRLHAELEALKIYKSQVEESGLY